MTAYYNEIDQYAAQWLRNLIAAGHIAPGDVDTRSIVDVQPDDLRGYRQCHFFAGIGGWSLALRIAGWPDDSPVWTGSCPCQPFSIAGPSKGEGDHRHLWPDLRRLVKSERPSVLFGEQSASKLGRSWFDGVAMDLENNHYSIAAAVMPAMAVGAPHMRNRLYFLADSVRQGLPERETASGKPRSAGAGQTRLYASRDSDSARYSIPAVAELCQADARIPCRVGQIRAYGNAIHPQLAAEFIGAYMDCAP